jgi:hypothetical protein
MAPVQHELHFPHLGAFVSCGLSQNETIFSDSGHSPLTKLWSLRTLKEHPRGEDRVHTLRVVGQAQ